MSQPLPQGNILVRQVQARDLKRRPVGRVVGIPGRNDGLGPLCARGRNRAPIGTAEAVAKLVRNPMAVVVGSVVGQVPCVGGAVRLREAEALVLRPCEQGFRYGRLHGVIAVVRCGVLRQEGTVLGPYRVVLAAKGEKGRIRPRTCP